MEDIEIFERIKMTLDSITNEYGLQGDEHAKRHDALILWYAREGLGLDIDEVLRSNRIFNDKKAEGIDAILKDANNKKFIFIQAEGADQYKPDKNFSENKVKDTVAGVSLLISGRYKPREITPRIRELLKDYNSCIDKKGYKTALIFLTLKGRPVSNKFIKAFQADTDIPVEFISIDKIISFYRRNTNTSNQKSKNVNVQLTIKAGGIIKKETPYDSRIFTTTGGSIAKMYEAYGGSIFQNNVRNFIGVGREKSINNQILATATKRLSKNFWYYNNGITITCNDFDISDTKKMITLYGAQIINGAQTTYSLHNAWKMRSLKTDVEVITKIIKSSNPEPVKNITISTNSQNPISARDLQSNDQIQLVVQKILKDLYNYSYERKRGEFNQSKNITKDKFIVNTKAAQAKLAMFNDKPAAAKSKKGLIFIETNGGFYNLIFEKADELLAEKLMISWKLLMFIEKKKKAFYNRYKNKIKYYNTKSSKFYASEFLLHSEYFILNIFKDFLENDKISFNKLGDIKKLVNEIDNNKRNITRHYNEIVSEFERIVKMIRSEDKTYTHNNFFKSENNIKLVREKFSKKYRFVSK